MDCRDSVMAVLGMDDRRHMRYLAPSPLLRKKFDSAMTALETIGIVKEVTGQKRNTKLSCSWSTEWDNGRRTFSMVLRG